MTATEASPAAPALEFRDLEAILDWLRANHPAALRPPSDRPTTVTEALCRVMADLPGIGKNQQSPQGYNYRGIEAITEHAQHLFARYGVVFGTPRVVERQTVDITVNGKPWTEEQLTIVYTVYGPSHGKVRSRRVPRYGMLGDELVVTGVVEIEEVVDDTIEVGPLLGLGRDNSDKGANKALTQAYKYALIQTLCIGDSKDDPDAQRTAETDSSAGPDEWWGGWATEDEMRDAIAHFRGTLRERVDAGRLSEEQAKQAWADYQHPDGPSAGRQARTRAQHQAIYAATFRDRPAAPTAAQEPPPADRTAPPAPTGETPVQVPEKTDEARPPRQLPPVPPDNGYRGRLDDVFAEGGVDAMIAALKQLDVEEVVGELQLRGAEVAGSVKVSEVRQILGAVLLARNAPSPADGPDSASEPADPASAPDTAPAAPKRSAGRSSGARKTSERGAPDAG